jgi:hypothetical protein
MNAQEIDSLLTQFQKRWEGIYHWRSMCSMLLGTPGLRAAWPMSVVDYQAPECTDISGHGYDLQAAGALGNVTFGTDPTPGIPPAAVFGGGANQYLVRADGGAGNWADIRGNETYIIAAQRGLSLGGWFYVNPLPAAAMMLMCKCDFVGQQSYFIRFLAGGAAQIRVYAAGLTSLTSTNTGQVGWNHVVGVYDAPNQNLHIILNGQVTSNLGGAVAPPLVDSTAAFTVGADSLGNNRLTGYGSDCWLDACALSTNHVRASYGYTKAAYGVK